MAHRIDIDRSKLHPWLNYKLQLFLDRCAKKGYYLIITAGYRSFLEQNRLYAQGRTKQGVIVTNAKGGYSQHNFGIAFDVAMNYDVDGDGKVSDDTWNAKGFKTVAKIAKKVGLGWGGDWKSIVDRPHFYLKKWGSTTEKIRQQYGTYEKFKKTWTRKVSGTKKGLNIWNAARTKVLKKKLKNGTKVNVMYKKLGYYKVEYKGTVGWMKAKYLK